MLQWIPFIRDNLARRPLRTGLTLVSIAASFTLFGLLESFRYAVATFADDYSNALVVQSRQVKLPYSHVTRLLQMPGVESACAYLLVFVELAGRKRLLVQAVPDEDVFVVHPGIVVPADARERWHRDRLAALIDAELASEQGWKVGDRVMLPATRRGPAFRRADGDNALEVVVAGVFSSTNALAAGRIFVRYDYVRDVIGADRAGLEYIAVRFDPAQSVDRLRTQIDSEFESSSAPVKTYSYRALLRGYYATFREVTRLAVVVLAVSFVTLLLIAGSVLIQAHRERARELAVMQALGVSRGTLTGMLLGEVLLMMLPAAALGLIAASLLMRQLPEEVKGLWQAGIPMHTVLVSIGLVVGLSVAVFLVPCARLWRMPVAAALARE